VESTGGELEASLSLDQQAAQASSVPAGGWRVTADLATLSAKEQQGGLSLKGLHHRASSSE